MYQGDILARLQSLESGISPVAPASAIAADPMTTSGERVTARVEQKLADGLFKVQIGIRTLQISLPPQTAVGSKLDLRQAPGGRWLPADSPQLVTARVDAKLADGTFSVKIGGRTLQLALPAETEPGQQIQLRQAADGSWSLAAPSGATSTQTAMSSTGRLLDLLLQAAPRQAPQTNSSAPLLASAPTESAAPALPAALMRALATALNDSGLFYESHLQQWNAGVRGGNTLAREPQAQMDLNTVLSAAGVNSGANSGTMAAANDANRTYGAAAEPAMAVSLQQAGVHPDALPLIARQLAVLETGQLTWNGELWPGQSMRWSIGRDETPHPEDKDSSGGSFGGASHSAPRSEPIWRTRLAINLPNLGEVIANLALQGNAVRISLSVPAGTAQASLTAAAPALTGALSNAGLNMQALEFAHEAAA
jgi:hypothetical protein